QIAKNAGATIVTTASKENEMFLYSLGADQVIDYRNEDFEDKIEEMDLVLDPIGGDTQLKSLEVLKKDGRLVTLAGLSDKLSKEQQEKVKSFSMKPTAE